jgi:hypothetical protein
MSGIGDTIVPLKVAVGNLQFLLIHIGRLKIKQARIYAFHTVIMFYSSEQAATRIYFNAEESSEPCNLRDYHPACPCVNAHKAMKEF